MLTKERVFQIIERIQWGRIFTLLTLILLITSIVTGCRWRQPPSVDRIQAIFQENSEDIQFITGWLLNSEYKEVYFWMSDLKDGTVWADFSDVPLDSEVLSCAKRLMLQKGFHSIEKSLYDNTIAFYIWTDHLEADCGVAYTIDSTKEPEVEYQITLEPISPENWFYFYSDYNKWRSLHTS